MMSESGPETEARAWLGRLYGDDVDARTLAEFRAWLAVSQANARSYRQLEMLWRELPAIETVDRPPVVVVKRARRRLWAVALAAAVVVAIVGVRSFDVGLAHTFSTDVGQIRTVKLTDGTDITLGPRTRLTVRMTRRNRSVALQSGEAFFAVARDPKRPLTVAAAGTEVRVLGTKFDVRRGPSTIDVAVDDGRVEVADRPESGAASRVDVATVVLVRGQEVSAALDGALGAPRSIDPDHITDWRSGRLRYIDAALQDVLADLNRYSATPIVYHDPSIGRIRITASFPVGEAQQILDSVAESNGLILQQSNSEWVMARR